MAEFCLSTLHIGIDVTFGITELLLAIAGLICLPLQSDLLRETAMQDDNDTSDEGLCIVH